MTENEKKVYDILTNEDGRVITRSLGSAERNRQRVAKEIAEALSLSPVIGCATETTDCGKDGMIITCKACGSVLKKHCR